MPPPPPRPRGRPGDKLDPAKEAQGPFQFPRMPFSEIQEDLNAYNRPISKEAFKSPNADDFKEIMDHFLYEIYDKRPDDFSQPGFGCLDGIEFPELYEDAIPKLHFFRQCQKMFQDAKFDEFSVRDVHAPERGRFHWILSALINFMKFRQTRLSFFEEITGNADELAEKERVFIEERTKLQKEIEEIQEARAKDEPEVEQLRELIEELGFKLSSLHKQQQDLVEKTRDAKATLKSKTEYAAAVKVKRMSEAEEVDRLRMRVVSSPDRAKGEIDDMTEALESEKENISSIEKRSRTIKLRTGAASKGSQDVEQACSILELLIAEQDRVRKLQSDVEKRSAELKDRLREIDNNAKVKKHLERVITSVQQKLNRINEQGVEVSQQSSEEDRALAEKEAHFGEEESKIIRDLEKSKAAITAMQEMIQNETNGIAEELDLFAKRQNALYDKFTSYHSDLQQTQEIISSHNDKSLEEFRDMIQG